MQKKSAFIFSIFVGYIILQFLWWEVLLVKQSNEIIEGKQNLASLSSANYNQILKNISDLESKKIHRVYMIVGEGTVFLLILLFGMIKVRSSIKKEIEVNEQQKNFILSVSHELKTPLAATKLQIQTLLKHQLERDKQVVLLNNALEETDRLNKLVENVLIANQLTNNHNAIYKVEFNFSELITQTINRYFHDLLDKQSIILTIEENIYLKADKDLIQSVIINLIDNAVKYSFNDVLITLNLKHENNFLVLEIKDCGIGVLEKERKKIFNHFYRVGSEENRKTKGTGIGLFLVKSICDLHHASIETLPNIPKGSIFKIKFQT